MRMATEPAERRGNLGNHMQSSPNTDNEKESTNDILKTREDAENSNRQIELYRNPTPLQVRDYPIKDIDTYATL